MASFSIDSGDPGVFEVSFPDVIPLGPVQIRPPDSVNINLGTRTPTTIGNRIPAGAEPIPSENTASGLGLTSGAMLLVLLLLALLVIKR